MKNFCRSIVHYNFNPITTECSLEIAPIQVFRSTINYKTFIKRFYLFNFRIFKQNALQRLNQNCLHHINNKWPGYDVYIPLASGAGEVFLLLSCINQILKERFSGKKVAILCVNEKLSSIAKSLGVHADIFINTDFTTLFLPEWSSTKSGRVWNPLNAEHFDLTERKILNKETTYIESLFLRIGRRKPIQHHPSALSIRTQRSRAFQNINFKKSIFLIPHAETIEDIDITIWSQIARELSNKGFAIYVNATSPRDRIPNTVPVMLSFMDAVLFGSLCECIVGMRCGLMEIILQTSAPKCLAVYTQFRKTNKNYLSAKDVIYGFSLHNLPCRNKDITEVIFDGNNNKIISSISSWASKNNSNLIKKRK